MEMQQPGAGMTLRDLERAQATQPSQESHTAPTSKLQSMYLSPSANILKGWRQE
jgi:hypothetical protein